MDTEKLLRSLNAHRVRYVVIGAAAFPVHGYSRVTLDIDIFIQCTERNARRTLDALRVTGYDVSDLSIEEILKKKILLRQYVLEADIHPHVKGVSFPGVWARKRRGRVGRTEAYFASLNDLIRMKKASARPKDKEDVKVLERLKERAKRRKKLIKNRSMRNG